MPTDIVTRMRCAATLFALVALPCGASAVPITMIFSSGVSEAPTGPGSAWLSGPVRLTYTFDSDLPNGSGPPPMTPGLASYGPISATLDFRGTSFALPLHSGITISQLPHVYILNARAQNVTIDGTLFANLSFSFALFDNENQVFNSLALPLDTAFVSAIDRFQVSLVADGRMATGGSPSSTFTLVVPENSSAALLAAGLLALCGLRVRRRRQILAVERQFVRQRTDW